GLLGYEPVLLPGLGLEPGPHGRLAHPGPAGPRRRAGPLELGELLLEALNLILHAPLLGPEGLLQGRDLGLGGRLRPRLLLDLLLHIEGLLFEPVELTSHLIALLSNLNHLLL